MQQPLNLTTSVGGVKGRVKVFVRPRPFDTDQMAQRGGCCLAPGVDNGIEVTDQDQRLHTFHFDRVFSMDASNRAVYEEVGRPLVDSVVTGFNGTLMAYGQTGTGKTHTVGSEDGLIACMVQQLFDSTATHAFRITLSYQQVYQERLYDLLRHPSVKERALPLREGKSSPSTRAPRKMPSRVAPAHHQPCACARIRAHSQAKGTCDAAAHGPT